ncbi:MAG: dienelactone hydrolase [uncultured Acidimicrobiales bacterium]|uniref:Dienelactone hydrolase n=1 Tax=uncultured Acidimicrobiales bacterium TaxID=310071 RepID=A0A6J4GYA7_9ACTN|nr:MAG: dienelactone hydrolase [uncultured Acidimicrobiales bacterium]
MSGRPPRAGLLVTPGAGASRDQPSLVAIEEALRDDGVAVDRMDFPYRLAGRKAPDRPPVLLASVRAGAVALAERTELPAERLFLGGRSLGGRMCSLAVADGLPAAGLVLVSYPLHPAGKPESLRVEHFPRITVPCLFVSGTRDSFGTPDELQAHTASIPGPVHHVWIEGGDHGLRGKDAAVAEAVRTWLLERLGDGLD